MFPPPHLSQPKTCHSSVLPSQQYQSHQTLFVLPIAYNSPQSLTQPMTEFPQMDSDPDIPDGQAAQTAISNTAAFQTKDLDAWVPHFEPYYTNMDNQSVHAMPGFEQTPVVDFIDNDITSDSNIIPTREKMIDSQMDDMIKEKLALKQQIDSLERNLSNQIKEKESLLQTFIAQRIKPTLYDGSVISSQHAASPVIDDEETLILEEVSRSKMLLKQKEPMSKEKKVNTTPINYVELNRLFEDFGKYFVPQKELPDEQAFWFQTSHRNTNQSASSPIQIEAPKELPQITPDAITEGEWVKGKETIENAAQIPIATTIAPGMFKIDFDPLAPIEQAKAKQPLDNALDFACKHAKRIQELLIYVQDTCPNAIKLSEKKVVVTSMNKVKKVRSQPTGNKKNDRISQKPSSNRKNKVEAQPRKVNKKNHVKEPICDVNVKHNMLNANSQLICIKYDQIVLRNSGLRMLKTYDRVSLLAHELLFARGIPMLKFKKDHLCAACALGKRKKSSHQLKAEDTNQEKLYLLQMDICGPMRVESINGKKYILVIVDNYSRFTWVRFLRSKDEAPDAIIKCIKNIQVHLNATLRNV
ncbi:retrovirus-related pol polyprotein from transposon TNT 1-94 [Tanacetum coccineum]